MRKSGGHAIPRIQQQRQSGGYSPMRKSPNRQYGGYSPMRKSPMQIWAKQRQSGGHLSMRKSPNRQTWAKQKQYGGHLSMRKSPNRQIGAKQKQYGAYSLYSGGGMLKTCKYARHDSKRIKRRKGLNGKTCKPNGPGCCLDEPWKGMCMWKSGECIPKTKEISDHNALDKDYEGTKLSPKMIEKLLLRYEDRDIDKIRLFLEDEFVYQSDYIGLFWNEKIRDEYIQGDKKYLVYFQARAIIDSDIKDGFYKLSRPN